MSTPNPFTGCLLAALIVALFVIGGLLDGPSDIEAMQATEASTQDAIHSVALEANIARADAIIDAQGTVSVLAQNTAHGAK